MRRGQDENNPVSLLQSQHVEQIISKRLTTEVLSHYYTPGILKNGNLEQYVYRIGKKHVRLPSAIRKEWLDLAIPLSGLSKGGEHIKFQKSGELSELSPISIPDIQMPSEFVMSQLRDIEQSEMRLNNLLSYHLVGLDIQPDQMRVSFSLSDFFRYRFTAGFLPDEIYEALVSTNLDVEKVVADRERLLPLRQQMLSDGASLVNFKSRMCIGGPVVLLAIARPKPDDDYVIHVKRRSAKVALTPRQLTLVPQGFHQPMVDNYDEVDVSFSALREFYEELLGGVEAERNFTRVKSDWFVDECEPLRWLRENPNSYTLECTHFGIDLDAGRYAFGILFVISDENFWKDYGSSLSQDLRSAG